MRSSTVLVFAAGANALQLKPSDRTDNSKFPGEVNDSSLVQESWGDAYYEWSDVAVAGSSAIGLGLYLGFWFGAMPVAATVMWPVTVALAGAGLLAKLIDSLLWFRSDAKNRKKLKSAEQNLVKEWKRQSGYEGDNPTSADLNKSFSHMLEVKEVNFQFLEDTSSVWTGDWWKHSEYIGQLMSIHFRQMQVGDKVTVAKDWTSSVDFWRTTGSRPNTKINAGLEFTVVHVPTSAMDESSRTIEKTDWDKWKDAFKKQQSKLVLRRFVNDKPRLVLETDVAVGVDTIKAGTVISKINGHSIKQIISEIASDPTSGVLTNPKQAAGAILDKVDADSASEVEFTFAEKVLGLKTLKDDVVLYLDVTDFHDQKWVQKKIVSSEQYNFDKLPEAEQQKFLSKGAKSQGLSEGAKMQKSSTQLSTNFSQQKTNIFTATSDMKEISHVFKKGTAFTLQRDVQESRLSEGDEVKFRRTYNGTPAQTKGTITEITSSDCVVKVANFFGIQKEVVHVPWTDVKNFLSPVKAKEGDTVKCIKKVSGGAELTGILDNLPFSGSDSDLFEINQGKIGRVSTSGDQVVFGKNHVNYRAEYFEVVLREDQLVRETKTHTIVHDGSNSHLGMSISKCPSQRIRKPFSVLEVVLKGTDAAGTSVDGQQISWPSQKGGFTTDNVNVVETKKLMKERFQENPDKTILYKYDSNSLVRFLKSTGQAWDSLDELVDELYAAIVNPGTTKTVNAILLVDGEFTFPSTCIVGFTNPNGLAKDIAQSLSDEISLKVFSASFGETEIDVGDYNNFLTSLQEWKREGSLGDLKLEVAPVCATCTTLRKGSEVKVKDFDSSGNLKVKSTSDSTSMYIPASQVDEVLLTPDEIKKFQEKYQATNLHAAKTEKATDVALTNFSTAVPVGLGEENTTIFRMFKSRLASKNDYEAPFFEIELEKVREQQIAQAEQVTVSSADVGGLEINDNWTVTKAPGSGSLQNMLNMKILEVGNDNVNDIPLKKTQGNGTVVRVSPERHVHNLLSSSSPSPITLKYIDEDKEFTVPITGAKVMKPDGWKYTNNKGQEAKGSITVSLKSLNVKAARQKKEKTRKQLENVQHADTKHREKIHKSEAQDAMDREGRAKKRKGMRAHSEEMHKTALAIKGKKLRNDLAEQQDRFEESQAAAHKPLNELDEKYQKLGDKRRKRKLQFEKEQAKFKKQLDWQEAEAVRSWNEERDRINASPLQYHSPAGDLAGFTYSRPPAQHYPPHMGPQQWGGPFRRPHFHPPPGPVGFGPPPMHSMPFHMGHQPQHGPPWGQGPVWPQNYSPINPHHPGYGG